jgi:glycosyltransferase involved in cell wall biosynthesis
VLTIILPTYNEADTIGLVLDRLASALASMPYELIVVDDSTDGTHHRVAEITRGAPHIRLIHRQGRRGLASAVVDGIAAASGDVICVLDADLQHPPEVLPRLVETLERAHADLVVASRYVAGGRYEAFTRSRRLASTGATVLARLLFPRVRPVSDPLSGFFAFRRGVTDGVALRPLGYKILLEVLVRGRLTVVAEVPYRFDARAAGESKLALRQHWEYLRHLCRLLPAGGWRIVGPAGGPIRRILYASDRFPGPREDDELATTAVRRRRGFVRHFKPGPVPRIRVIGANGQGSLPKVSVIIPSGDGTRAEHLTRLLRQLDEQPFRLLEVIVVEGDRRQGRAINTGAAIARGGLLITMDDDTQLGDPLVIEKLVAAFEADPTIGIAGVSNLVPDGAPPIVRRAMRELPRRSSPPVQCVIDSDMAEHPCLAIRRDLFQRIGGEHEVIPRGLDPYLRREVRRLGQRVVVIPDAWIHHLLPSSLRAILRQYFRNGVGAAYVRKFHREYVIEQAEQHGRAVGPHTSLGSHALRYMGRFVRAVLSVRWIYLGTLITYAMGYAWGLVTLREDSL